MKLKYAWVALIALTFFGCSDNTGSLGLGMFPESDQNIKGNLMPFDVTTQSALAEKTFALTSVGYIGKFTDPYFGYYEAGFLSQLHCIDKFKFPSVYDENKNKTGILVSNKIYATELVLSYSTYFGDSLTPCRMSIYQLNKDLNKDDAKYTNIDPTQYYNVNDPKSLIGRKAYSAIDLSVSDSIRNLENYYPSVRISLPTEIGQKIYDASREAEETGKGGLDNETFQKLFHGIYAKSDFGDGTVLYIEQIEMNVVYEVYEKDSTNTKVLKKKYEKNPDGTLKDSTAHYKSTFAATKEIIQANKFSNDEQLIIKRKDEAEWTYLKTPAGIYTQATLPLKEIEEKLSKDTINAVKLVFTNYNQSNDYNKYKYSISAPTDVLLVREKDKEKFFNENEINDEVTSYLAGHNSRTNQYVFYNLARLVSACLEEKEAAKKAAAGKPWDEDAWIAETKWDKVALIPVLVGYDVSNSTSGKGNVISVQNDLKPGYVKLKGGKLGETPGNVENKLKLEVIYTSFGDKK